MEKSNSLKMVRAHELAELLGIHIVTLFKWERRGLIPKRIKIGPNTTCWRESDILDWLERRAKETAAA